MVGVYVDDLIITGGSQVDINKFKLEMQSTFKMSDLGLLHYYLGLEVPSRRRASLCARAHMRQRSWRRRA